LIKDDLWRIVNEKICIRKIILATFNELDMKNMFFRRYEMSCYFNCTKNEDFIAKINLCIRSRFSKFKAKTFDYKRRAMKKALKVWRNQREFNKFILNYIIDDNDYEFFLDNEIIKKIIKNVHLMKIVKNFLAISMNWSRNWLNKYVEKLIVLVIHATTNAKKSNRQAITSTINNNFSIKNLIIEKTNAIEKSNNSTRQDSFVVFVIFIIFFASRIASILTTFFASRVVTISTIFRLKRKKHEFMLNNDSSLRSRNVNFVMREIIEREKNNNQQSNKSRRTYVIINDVFRRNNLEDL
jgi:hypothetical protein